MCSSVARASEKESPAFRHGENVNCICGDRYCGILSCVIECMYVSVEI